MFNISVLLDVQANLPETSPFFVCPNGFSEHLLSNVYSTYILGMYNFGRAMKFRLLLVRMMAEWLMSIGQYFGMKFIKKGNLRRAIPKHE